jgi:hypothetical protein
LSSKRKDREPRIDFFKCVRILISAVAAIPNPKETIKIAPNTKLALKPDEAYILLVHNILLSSALLRLDSIHGNKGICKNDALFSPEAHRSSL